MRQESEKSIPLESSEAQKDRSNEYELLSKIFDAVKADQRHVGGTLYAAQQANVRNYLWVSSLLMTAIVAFFTASGMSRELLGVVVGVTPLTKSLTFTLICLMGSAMSALAAFVGGILAGTGTYRRDDTSRLFGMMQGMAQERDAALEILKRSRSVSWSEREKVDFLSIALRDESENLQGLMDEIEARGKRLRFIGEAILTSIGLGIVSAAGYWFALF